MSLAKNNSNNEEYHPRMDRIFRVPRVWSNRELEKFASLFTGSIVNISGWKDIDKEGKRYKDYFINAASYFVSNYKAEAKGISGLENEFYLDLEEDLDPSLRGKFQVVFNHTVLEHVYHVKKAFKNICDMTSDVAIIVVPFLQQMHAHYGDYWRFTPLTMKKMFEENGMNMIYCTFNSHTNASVYLFCIATKTDSWSAKIPNKISHVDSIPANTGFDNWVGCHAIQNNKYSQKRSILSKILSKLKVK